MKKFKIVVNRIATEEFEVEANSKHEAKEAAAKAAINHDWASCADVLYEVETPEEI